ncbi:protein-glutamine glutaminase family protein [Kitasatospora sp. NPDC048286]|uniref:WXG100-like domain-containing protein n=1 Tax=Kitasatospora sp. NPDC048286 TaxID=3364047 RepID=UPI003712CD6F
MSHSSIHVSPGLAQFFHIISGMPWPESDEGLLRDVRDDYQALADDLPKLSGYILDAVQGCDKRLEGEAAKAFRQEWGKFVNTDESNDPLRKAGELCTQLADLAGKVANTVEYTKWMAIGQLIQLLFEIALAIAWSVFTGGASLAAVELKKILTREFLLWLVKKLLALIVMHTFGGVVGGLMLDAIIQGIQFERGDRHEWDKDLTKQAAIFGALSGAIGGPLSLLGMGLGKLLGPRLSKLFVESALNDVIKGLAGGVGKDLAEGVAAGALKGIGKDLGEGVAGGALKGIGKDLGEGVAGGALKGAGKEAGEGFGKLLGNEAAERFANGIAKLLKENSQYLAKGFKGGRKVGMATGEKFVRELGELFEKELGKELGEQLARQMGEQIGKQFVQHSLKTVAKESSREALKEALENIAKDGGKVGLTPELKLLVEKMPELAGGINKMDKMFHLGAVLGSQFESGINQYLTEGIYNTIYNGEWSAGGMSFVGGFMMAGMRHMIMGLASPLTLRYADFVRGLESSRITDENGGFYSKTHPITFLSVISNMGGHAAPFPVPRPGHIDQIGGTRLSGGDGASIKSDGASIKTEGPGSFAGSTLPGSGSHHREENGDGVLADPEGKSSFHSSVDGGWDPKAPVRPVETQSRGDERTAATETPKPPAAPGGRDAVVPPPVPRKTDGGAENTTTTTTAPGGGRRNADGDTRPVNGGERGSTATASADANGQGAVKSQPQPQAQVQPKPDPSRRTTVVDEHGEPPLQESTTTRVGGPRDGTQPDENTSHRSPAASPPPPPIRTSASGPGDGAAPVTPNRPDPNHTDPSRPEPNRPDPNRPDPNRPDPDHSAPRTPQGLGPDPLPPLPPTTPPRDPKPDGPRPDPNTPDPNTPDTAPTTTASGHLYHQVDAPEHAKAPAGDERRTAWRDKQQSLAEEHDARLAEAEQREATRLAIEERLTEGAGRLPRELRALVTPDSPVWRRAAESMRESIEARPHEREEILAGAADRLELAGARELALTFAVGRFDRLLADRGLGPERSGDHTLAEIRREASEKFRADAEQDVAQLFTARTDLTPERNALAARALERRLSEAGRDLDVRQARARVLEKVDRVVDDAHAQWSADGLSEGDRALLDAAGLAGDVRLSPQARDQLAETLGERLADLHGGDEDAFPRIEEEGGESLAPVDPTRLGRARLEADFQEALDRHQAGLSHDFTVQAVREAVLKRATGAVDDAAAGWKDTAAEQFGPESLRELGLADGPSPRAVAAARADLAARTDRLVAEHTAADRDPAHLKAELDKLTSRAEANRLLALHGAREEALRAAEDSARAHVPHDLGGPEGAARHEGDAAASVETALGPVRGNRSEPPATSAARRVREGYTERVRAAFEETFRSLLRDPAADHRTDLPERLAHWRGERERLAEGLADHVAFERAVLPARERAAAGYDRLAEDRRVPEAEIGKLKTEYGGDFFDAYRDHWAPEDLNSEHWRDHEATHENVFGRRPVEERPEAENEPSDVPSREPVSEPTPVPDEKPAADTPSGPLTRPTDTAPDTTPDTAPKTPAAAPPTAPPVLPPAVPHAAVPPAEPRPLLPASAWADIRSLAPSARMDTVRFDARVRGQDNPGAIAGPKVREQYENREQRPGGLPRAQRSLGDLHGADTGIKYDVRRFEAQPGHWVTEFTLNLHLTGPDGRPLPQAAATRMLDRARAVVADRFNEQHRLPGGDQVHLRLESTPKAAGAHQNVTVLPGTGRSDQLHWYDGSAPGVLLHELLHFLGLPDEYVEPAAKPGDAFALRRRDRWAGENGVMGTAAHRDDFAVLPRHLQRIEDVLHSGPVLRDLTHGQYLTHQEGTVEAPAHAAPANGTPDVAASPVRRLPNVPAPVHQSPVNVLFGGRLHHVVDVPGDGDRLLPAVVAGGGRLATWEHGELTVERMRELAPEWDTTSYQDAPRVIAERLGIRLVVHEGQTPHTFDSGVTDREVHVYRDPRPGQGQVAQYSQLTPDVRRTELTETDQPVNRQAAAELTGLVQPGTTVVTLAAGQPVFRVTDAPTMRGYLLQGIRAVTNKDNWAELGPGLYTGHDFAHAANYSESLRGLPVVMELVLGRVATGLQVKKVTGENGDWTNQQLTATSRTYDFLTDGTQFKFHPNFFKGLLQAEGPPQGSSNLRVVGLKVKEGPDVWRHYTDDEFNREFEDYLVSKHQETAAQLPRRQDVSGPGRTPDPVPTNEALDSAPHASPEDLRSIRYLEHAEAYEQRLATHLLQREDVQREVRKVVDLAWGMTTGDKDKAKFGSKTAGTTGMVGTDRHMLQDVVDRGNLRERMALLYNGYTSDHFAKLVRQRKLPRPEQLTQERADRHDLGGEVVTPLIAEIKKVYGEFLKPTAERAEQPVPFGPFRTDEPYGPLINRIRDGYVEFQNRQLYDYNREQVVDAAQKAAERLAKTMLETDHNPLDVNPPLGRGEWYSAVGKDGRLGWHPGAKSYHYKLDSALQQDAHDTGGLVATGTSGTAFGMLQAVKELVRTPAGRNELARTGAEPVDFELLRLGLLGWMLESGDHTFHEIMAGSRLFADSLTPEERADPNLTGTDLTYRDTHHRYRFLSPLTERELREEVAPGGVFPDEHLVGHWSVDDPDVTGLAPDGGHDSTDADGTTGDGGFRDSAAAPLPSADQLAVDLARRHLDAANRNPDLYEFMGWIKAGAFTGKRDDEGMIRIREGERYESLLADVQRFLDHAKALNQAGTHPAGQSLRLYRAVRMDPQGRERDAFTELLPASTSFSREFVEGWMSNGGGADNYALFQIKVPLEHPMLALSFPPGHVREEGDPEPVNESQSEVTLGPSWLTVTGRDDDGGFHVIRVDASPMTVDDIRAEVANWSSGTSMADAFRGFTDFYSPDSLRAAYPFDFNPQHRITQSWSEDRRTKTVRIEHSHEQLSGQFAEAVIRHEDDGSVSIRWRSSDDDRPREPMVYNADNIGDVSGGLRSGTLTENPSFESLDLPGEWYSPDYDWQEPEAPTTENADHHLADLGGDDDLHQAAAAPPLPRHEGSRHEEPQQEGTEHGDASLVPSPPPDPPATDRSGALREALVHHDASGAHRLDDPDADPQAREQMAATLNRFPVDERFLTVAMHTGADGVPRWQGKALTEDEGADLLVSLYDRGAWDGIKPVLLVACSSARDGDRSFAAGMLRRLRLRLPELDPEVYAPKGVAWFAPPVLAPFRSDPHGPGSLVVGRQLGFDASGRPVLVDGGNWARLKAPRDAAPDAPIVIHDLGAHLPVDASRPPRSTSAPEGYTVVRGGPAPHEREPVPQEDALAFAGPDKRKSAADTQALDPDVGPSSSKRHRQNDPGSSDEEMSSGDEDGGDHSESDGDTGSRSEPEDEEMPSGDEEGSDHSESDSESESEGYRGFLEAVKARDDELAEEWREADADGDVDRLDAIDAERAVLAAVQNVGTVHSVRAADALLRMLAGTSMNRSQYLELRVRRAELAASTTDAPTAEEFRQLRTAVLNHYRPDDPGRVDGCEFRAHALSELIDLAAPQTGRRHLAKIWASAVDRERGYVHAQHRWNHHVAVVVHTADGERVIDPLLFPDRAVTPDEWRDVLAVTGQPAPHVQQAPWEFFGGPDRAGRIAAESAVLIDDSTREQIDERKNPDLTAIDGQFSFGERDATNPVTPRPGPYGDPRDSAGVFGSRPIVQARRTYTVTDYTVTSPHAENLTGTPTELLARAPFADREEGKIAPAHPDLAPQDVRPDDAALFPNRLPVRPVTVEHKPELTVSADGTLAAKNETTFREFYATQEVVDRANVALRESGGNVTLSLHRDTFIQFEHGGGTVRLFKVGPEFSKDPTDICRDFAADVLGGNFTHLVLHDQLPPDAGGTGRTVTARINTLNSLEVSGVARLAEGIADAAQQGRPGGLGLDRARSLVNQDARRGPHEWPAPGEAYGDALRTGKQDGGSLDRVTRSLGLNENAYARPGEGYVIQSLPAHDSSGSRAYDKDHSGLNEHGRGFGYHFAAVVVESLDGSAQVALQNANRREGTSELMRKAVDENLDVHGPHLETLIAALRSPADAAGPGTVEHRRHQLALAMKEIRDAREVQETTSSTSSQAQDASKREKRGLADAARLMIGIANEAHGRSGDAWFFTLHDREDESFYTARTGDGGYSNPLAVVVKSNHHDDARDFPVSAVRPLNDVTRTWMDAVADHVAKVALWRVEQGMSLPGVSLASIVHQGDSLEGLDGTANTLLAAFHGALTAKLDEHAPAAPSGREKLRSDHLRVVRDFQLRAAESRTTDGGWTEGDVLVRLSTSMESDLLGAVSVEVVHLVELARETRPGPVAPAPATAAVTAAEAARMRDVVHVVHDLFPSGRLPSAENLTVGRRLVALARAESADPTRRFTAADLDPLVRRVRGLPEHAKVRNADRRELLRLAVAAAQEGRPVTEETLRSLSRQLPPQVPSRSISRSASRATFRADSRATFRADSRATFREDSQDGSRGTAQPVHQPNQSFGGPTPRRGTTVRRQPTGQPPAGTNSAAAVYAALMTAEPRQQDGDEEGDG